MANPFYPWGAHWVPAVSGLQWNLQWNPADIEKDFILMKSLLYNTVRLDLFWAWFEPYPGVYNEQAVEQLDFLIELAHRYEIYLHPTFFIGGEVGEAYWDVPWRHGRHPHGDAEMLRLQTDHAAYFAKRYATEPAILAWDLTDEPPFWIAIQQTTDAMAINWTRLIAGAIRKYDPNHVLCVGTAVEDLSHGPFRPDNLAEEVDFFSAHPYSIYSPDLFPDAMLSLRGTYCGTFQTALSGGAGHPVMIHELGASSAQYSEERITQFNRVTMYSALGAGANGFLLWCFTDAAPEIFKKAPYLRAPHETQFGMTTWDRKERPQGIDFRKFVQITSRMNLQNMQPAPADAAIIVPFEWQKPYGDFSAMGLSAADQIPYVSTSDGGALLGDAPNTQAEQNGWIMGSWLSSYVLCRQADIKPAFVREYEFDNQVGMLILPSPLTSTEHNLVHVHTSFWDQVKGYLQNGGALYASLCADAAIPFMDEIFGASMADHKPVQHVEIKMVRPFGSLKSGDTFTFETDAAHPAFWANLVDVHGAEIIAVDQDGDPALLCYSCGKGKVLLCTYPIETYLAKQPAAFDSENSVYSIYQAFRQWVQVQPLVQTNHPAVEVSSITGNKRGYSVFTNHSVKAVEIEAKFAYPLKTSNRISETGMELLEIRKETIKICIPAWSGTILEWERED